jgi:DNA-binding transcriptional regulator YiaG
MKRWTSKEIKDLRNKYGLTQTEIADLLGVAQNYVYMLEKEVRTPSKTLQLLLDCVENNLRKGE